MANPVSDREADAIAAFIQGALAAACKKIPMKIADVEIPTDERGDYRDYFTVVTGAGHRIQVRVRPE